MRRTFGVVVVAAVAVLAIAIWLVFHQVASIGPPH